MVYVIESEVKAGESLAWILQSAGFHVVSFSRGSDFLREVGPLDRGCVLVNLRLSDVDCVTVLDGLASRRIAMPVVLYGGKGRALSIVQPLPSGAAEDDCNGSFGLTILGHITRAMEICEATRAKRRRSEEARSRLSRLTRRELEIAQLVTAGSSNKAIAFDLGISERTVEIHRSRIMRKTESDSLADLVWLFASAGLSSGATFWPLEELRRYVDGEGVSALN